MGFSRAIADKATINGAEFMPPGLMLADSLRREGKYDEARAVLADEQAEDVDSRLRLETLRAAVEFSAGDPAGAIRIMLDASPLADLTTSYERLAKYHNQLAAFYHGAGESDSASIEYSAAAFYWQEAGRPYDAGCTENNTGLLHMLAGRFAEAHAYMNRARAHFADFPVKAAEVDESEAQIYLAEGRPEEAEPLVIGAMKVFYDHGEGELLKRARYTLIKAAADCQSIR